MDDVLFPRRKYFIKYLRSFHICFAKAYEGSALEKLKRVILDTWLDLLAGGEKYRIKVKVVRAGGSCGESWWELW